MLKRVKRALFKCISWKGCTKIPPQIFPCPRRKGRGGEDPRIHRKTESTRFETCVQGSHMPHQSWSWERKLGQDCDRGRLASAAMTCFTSINVFSTTNWNCSSSSTSSMPLNVLAVLPVEPIGAMLGSPASITGLRHGVRDGVATDEVGDLICGTCETTTRTVLLSRLASGPNVTWARVLPVGSFRFFPSRRASS